MDFNGGQTLKNPVIVTVTFNWVVPDAGKDTGSPVVDSGQPDSTVTPADAAPDAPASETGPSEAGPIDSGTVDSATPDAAVTPGPDPLASTLEQFGDVITTTTWWKTVMSGYGIGVGKGGGHVRLPDSLGPGQGTVSNNSIADEQIQAFIQQEITASALPAPTADTIYAMYFPPSTTVVLDNSVSCQQFGGYHSATQVTDNNNNVTTVAYAVIVQCNFGNLDILDQTTFSASHEFAEACSDPGTGNGALGYYMISNDAWPTLGQGVGSGEIGDLCNTLTGTAYHASGYAVQRIWSNSAAAASEDPCQPTDDYQQPYIYYNAAVDTVKVKDANGIKADGYLPVKRGQSGTFDVLFFSDSKLVNGPAALSVGALNFQDPATLAAVPDGVMASVSLTNANNGDAATLNVTVPSGAIIGQFPNRHPVVAVRRHLPRLACDPRRRVEKPGFWVVVLRAPPKLPSEVTDDGVGVRRVPHARPPTFKTFQSRPLELEGLPAPVRFLTGLWGVCGARPQGARCPRIPRLVSAALASLAVVVTTPAHANPAHLQVDWIKTVLDAQQWLGASAFASRSGAPGGLGLPPPLLAAEEPGAIVGSKPHWSLVGRDWNQSFGLSGRLSVLDAFHLSQDSRMVVARVGFGDGAIVPFAQVGLGQWRVDKNWLPLWVSDTEVATQIGAGMELRVRGAYSVAAEADYTVLYRDQPSPSSVPFPRMWSALAAARMHF